MYTNLCNHLPILKILPLNIRPIIPRIISSSISIYYSVIYLSKILLNIPSYFVVLFLRKPCGAHWGAFEAMLQK